MSPRLVLPLMSLEARGKLKGLGVFYRKNGQNWIKDFQTYTDSPTLAESFQRLRIRAKVAAWKALAAAEKASWNDAARARGGTLCGYTLFMKEHTLSGNWYQDLIDACAAAPRALGSLSDVDDSGKAAGFVPTWNPAENKWLAAPPAAAGPAPFIDDFDDASRHWAWYDHNVAAGKTISESGSTLTISAAAGTPSDWWSNSNSAPKAIMSIPSAPCDIITKINAFTANACCQAGLFIAADPIGQGNAYAYFLTCGNTGIDVSAAGVSSLGSNPSTTLPVWLRIRVLNENKGSFRAVFSFSVDGSSFTDIYTLSGYPILAGKPSCGIFVKNWTGNAISAPFEFFKIIPSTGPAASAASAAPVSFIDNFSGASIFSDWSLYGVSGSVRTITQADGRLKISASAGQECSGYLPRAFLPVPFFPCEIETKLAAYNKGERTVAGLFIGPDGHGAGSSINNRFIDQIFSSGDGFNSIRIEGNSAQQAIAANATVPKWMKVRVMGSHQYAKWHFYYSVDGSSWTLLYSHELANALGGLACGLFVGNWYNQPAVSAEFEYFKITPYSFSGPG